MNTEFTTREEYKKFVTEWKHFYSTLTKAIRLIKATDRKIRVVAKHDAIGETFSGVINETLLKFSNVNVQKYYDGLIDTRQEAKDALMVECIKHKHANPFHYRWWSKHDLKRLARELLQLRKDMKVKSHQQWLTERGLTQPTT